MSTTCFPQSPITEVYKGKPIRPINVVVLKFGAAQYKAILDAVDETGLSVHQVLGHSGKPCDRCKGLTIAVWDPTGNPRYIKKGLLGIPHKNGGDNTLKYRGKKKIVNTSTGEEFTSIRKVSDMFKLNYPTLCAKLRGILKNDTIFIYAEITTVNPENIASA